MADLLRLFLLEARAAWMLLIVLGVEYFTALRGERVKGLAGGAVPPWWRDRAYLKAGRSLFVSRLWLVVVLMATLVWANAADFTGIVRVQAFAAGSALVARSWLNLKTDALARAVWRYVAPVLLSKGLAVSPESEPQPDESPSL